VGGLSLTLSLRSDGRARDLQPDLEALAHRLAVLRGGEPVASRSEVLSNGTVGREEALV
jgi:hypothetical protein